MVATIRKPEERECERCGRVETWDDRKTSWVIAEVDGERQIGEVHCLHEWDINGSFNPLVEDEA